MDDEKKVMTELSFIIARMDKKMKAKIPVELRKSISKRKDNSYIFYNKQLPLSEQELLPDTKAILSILYSDYICSNDEKEKWNEFDKYKRNLLLKNRKYSHNN